MSVLVHLGAACVTKKIEDRANFGFCLMAAYVPDIIGLPFMITNTNGTNISHSLFMAAICSSLFALAMYFLYKDKKIALVLLVSSLCHWLIDLIAWPMTTIMPKLEYLPLFFESDSVLGFGLYRSFPAMIITESIAIVFSVVFVGLMFSKRRKA